MKRWVRNVSAAIDKIINDIEVYTKLIEEYEKNDSRKETVESYKKSLKRKYQELAEIVSQYYDLDEKDVTNLIEEKLGDPSSIDQIKRLRVILKAIKEQQKQKTSHDDDHDR